MSHPVGIKRSSDRPRSNCATTWRPASSMRGRACCHMSSTGAQTSSQEVEVRPSELGRLPEPAEARRGISRVPRGLGGHVQVERARWRRRARWPARARRGPSSPSAAGVLGEDLHLGEAGLLRAVVPEVADAVRQVLSPREHLGQLRIPGLHGGSGGDGEQPRQVAGQRGRGRHRLRPGEARSSSVNIGMRLY